MTCKEAKIQAKRTLSGKRYQHTVNVKKMAVKLALRYGVDPEKAALAAWLHDLAKELPRAELLQIMRDNAIMAQNAETRPSPVWHGICAAILAKTKWGVDDEEILQAVACHTTGRPGMTKLDKILFLADMTSAERTWPGVEALRALEMDDLDAAMLQGLRETIRFVEQGNKPMDPLSIAACADLEEQTRKGNTTV